MKKLLTTSITAFLSIFCSAHASQTREIPYKLVNMGASVISVLFIGRRLCHLKQRYLWNQYLYH